MNIAAVCDSVKLTQAQLRDFTRTVCERVQTKRDVMDCMLTRVRILLADWSFVLGTWVQFTFIL